MLNFFKLLFRFFQQKNIEMIHLTLIIVVLKALLKIKIADYYL